VADLTAGADSRVDAYARLLVERCLDVQPGWQVIIRTTHLAAPAIGPLQREIAKRGGYALLRIGWTWWPVDLPWAEEAPEELVGELPEIDRFACDTMDARISMDAPENTRHDAALTPERLGLARGAERYFYRRSMGGEIPWVSCQFPTNALAQEAGMTLSQFEDFFYGACLIDWDGESERLHRYTERFNAAEQVRIVGPGTDLVLSLAGREGEVDDGHENMPGGEFFFSPIEDSAEGVIDFSEFPTVYQGHEFAGVRLVFRGGEVVDAFATKNEANLHSFLDRDAGARRIGELGIGCNPGITRAVKSTLFDEKIDGSIHLALGQSYAKIGGTNESSIHWDIVKDLRSGGRIELDGEVVQQDGEWLI
jgi:aminopeptidase